MSVNWTNDLIFELIDLYRERRLLWDHNMPANKDKHKKQQKWQEIADVLDVDKEEVMRKMKILTTQFYREYARNRQLPAEEGSASASGSKWFAYSKMLFLGPYRNARAAETTPTSATVTAINAYDHYQVSPIDEYSIEVKEEMEMSEGESFQWNASASASPGARRKRAAPAPTPTPTPPVEAGAARDEYSVYAEYVAVKLRTITDAHARHKAQQQINDILFRAQMGDL